VETGATRLREVGKRIRHPVRVGYADTDQGGVVHHSVYLRWLEQARVEYLRAHGIVYRDMEFDQKFALPVVQAKLRYRLPALFDEELEVETWVGHMGGAVLRFDYTIWRDDERLLDAEIKLACVGLPGMKPQRLPDVIREACTG